MTNPFPNKLVAIINKKLEPGRAMNTLSHLSLGLGGALGKDELNLDTYTDADSNEYPFISQMPFIILRAKPGEIRKTVLAAREKGILFNAFTDAMTEGTWQDQMARSQATKEEDLTYFGCMLYGDWDTVAEMTRKFSLWK